MRKKFFYLIYIIFAVNLIIFHYSLSFDFNEYKKNTLENLDFEKKLKVTIDYLIINSKYDEANNLFKFYEILKFNPKDKKQVIKNVLYIPKDNYVILISKPKQEFYIISNDGENLKITYTDSCITGKRQGDKLQEGDQKTPNGIYFPVSFIPSSNLSEIYGNGAFPLNYPNIVDKYILKRNGHGIWLHATNDNNRPPFSSNGCVVVKNNVFDQISKYIKLKETPIIIVDKIDYVNVEQLNKAKNSIAEFIYNWKVAWENTAKGKKLDKYFSFYSKNMVSNYGNFSKFKIHKTRISKNKKWIKIFIDDIYILKDGRVLDFGDLYVVSFNMEYKSNNYNWKGRKILYLIKEGGQWKILAEESL